MTTLWQGWEYGLLAENHSEAKLARLLNRSINEIRHREITWAGWYCRLRLKRRCFGAPKYPRRLFRLAAKVIRDDFPGLDGDEGRERYTYEVISYTLRRFDPAKGDQNIPIEERFVSSFRCWLRQRLKKEKRGRRRRRCKRRPTGADTGPVFEYERWSRLLYEFVVGDLNERARVCLELRMDGRSYADIAHYLGIAPRTLTNSWSDRRLVQLVQEEVRDLVLGWPVEKLRVVVWHLLVEVGLQFKKAACLLCVPEDELRARLGSGQARILRFEEIVGLLRKKVG